MTLDEFLAGAAPIGVLDGTPQDASSVRYRLPDAVVREVRGTKMPTVAAVFDEFAAAFQFPYYFGANKDAFDECMRDLDEFTGAAVAYVVVVRDADRLLAAEPAQLAWFAEVMAFYAAEWAARDVVFRVLCQPSGVPGRHPVVTLS